MLRLVVLVLMLLNMGYLAWGQGWLLPYGIGPALQREPERLARQIHPEAIHIVRAEEAAPSSSDDKAAPLACLMSEVLDAEQVNKLRPLLKDLLPAQAWTLDEFTLPARWIVYMGKYANAAEVDKKRSELARLGVAGEAPRNPTLAPGIALGAFELQAQADAALKTLTDRGVHTAHVVQDLPPAPGFRLRLPGIDAASKSKLAAVQSALPGQGLQPCAAPSAPG